jgi:hypothetical protein
MQLLMPSATILGMKTRYGKLTFLRDAGQNKHGQALWELRCDCGKTATKIASAVRIGRTRSCGCLKAAGNRRTHGMRVSSDGKQGRTYTAWMNMRARCDTPSHPSYHNYGGRGITYDERWASFDAFFADMGQCPDDLTLERKDVDGDYGKANCRWATRKEQGVNKRVNRRITFDGRTMALVQWAEELGIPYMTLYYRLKRGMPKHRALIPVKYSRWDKT